MKCPHCEEIELDFENTIKRKGVEMRCPLIITIECGMEVELCDGTIVEVQIVNRGEGWFCGKDGTKYSPHDINGQFWAKMLVKL